MAQLMTYAGGAKSVRGASFIEGSNGAGVELMARVLHLGNNPLVSPIPAMGVNDPVRRPAPP
jgi:hypothetical protein